MWSNQALSKYFMPYLWIEIIYILKFFKNLFKSRIGIVLLINKFWDDSSKLCLEKLTLCCWYFYHNISVFLFLYELNIWKRLQNGWANCSNNIKIVELSKQSLKWRSVHLFNRKYKSYKIRKISIRIYQLPLEDILSFLLWQLSWLWGAAFFSTVGYVQRNWPFSLLQEFQRLFGFA